MDFKTRVTRIGNHALNTEDQMLVLFGESVTQEIAENINKSRIFR